VQLLVELDDDPTLEDEVPGPRPQRPDGLQSAEAPVDLEQLRSEFSGARPGRNPRRRLQAGGDEASSQRLGSGPGAGHRQAATAWPAASTIAEEMRS
jgi:hypothetical protein